MTYPVLIMFEKTAQIFGVIIDELDNDKCDFYDAMSIMYMADLQSILETSYPILRYQDCSMKLIDFDDYFEFSDPDDLSMSDVKLVKDPGVGQLCEYEIDTIKEKVDKYYA